MNANVKFYSTLGHGRKNSTKLQSLWWLPRGPWWIYEHNITHIHTQYPHQLSTVILFNLGLKLTFSSEAPSHWDESSKAHKVNHLWFGISVCAHSTLTIFSMIMSHQNKLMYLSQLNERWHEWQTDALVACCLLFSLFFPLHVCLCVCECVCVCLKKQASSPAATDNQAALVEAATDVWLIEHTNTQH